MINHSQIKFPFLIRLFLIIGLILPANLSVSSLASAKGEMARFSNPHYISTSEFGVTNPQGMAFLPDENSFIIGKYIQ